jgi:RNA polymerase sigma-70 factor (ECF subfamily)
VGERSGSVDEATLREFVHTSYSRLIGAIALISGSRTAAEDAVQEALARALERSQRGDHIESLPAWITTVSMNLARSGLRRLRAERRARERLVTPTTGGDVEETTADRVDLRRALAGLPRRQREAIVLRYYLGLDVREIANTLGSREGTVKSHLARGRAVLAVALKMTDLEEVAEREEG